jgi:DNA-binding NarL/FixJ family response regulator
MPIEQALAATEAPPRERTCSLIASTHQVTRGLSPREREVAALLALGLTNRQIAERLVVTEGAVAAHIEHILDKLGFASRHQVGTGAEERGLSG